MSEIPYNIRVNTGDQEPIYRMIDCFFKSTSEKIQRRTRAMLPEFEIKVLNSHVHGSDTDNVFHLLLYKERVIAVVTETRTDSNYIQFDFFRNLEGIAQ